MVMGKLRLKLVQPVSSNLSTVSWIHVGGASGHVTIT